MPASTTQSSYLVPTNFKVNFKSILSAGDVVGVKNDGSPYKIYFRHQFIKSLDIQTK